MSLFSGGIVSFILLLENSVKTLHSVNWLPADEILLPMIAAELR